MYSMIDWKEKGGEAISEVFEVCRLNLSGLLLSGHPCVRAQPPPGVWATGDAGQRRGTGLSEAICYGEHEDDSIQLF